MNNTTQTAQISSLVQELNKACIVIQDSELQKEAARSRALSAAKDLLAKLESPAETIFQHAFSVRTRTLDQHLPSTTITFSVSP